MSQLDLTERILRLRSVPVLTGLSAADLGPLAASLRQVSFRKGDILLKEDEPPRSFFLIGSGTVVLRRKQKLVGTIRGPGGVGFMSFLARDAGGTSAVAQTYVEALEVRADAMDEVFEDNFIVLLGTMRLVTTRLIEEYKVSPPAAFVPPAQPFDTLVGENELGIVERIFLLRKMRAFSAGNVNSLATLASKMTELRPAVGTPLWKIGDRADHSLFIVKGKLQTSWNDGKSNQVMGPGYVAGGAESLASIPRWNNLVVTEPAVLLRSAREALIDLFEDDTELGMRFISLIATLLVNIWDQKAEEGITSVGVSPGDTLVATEPDGEAPVVSLRPPELVGRGTSAGRRP